MISEFENRASDYSLFMTGFLPRPEDAKDLFEPEGAQVFGVFLERHLIGILQVIWLELKTDAISLLMLDPQYRRHKLGTRVFEAYRIWARSRGIQKTIIFVSLDHQPAIAFWLALGFGLSPNPPEAVTFGAKTHVMQELEFEL
jgi:GNAT superfamily N-acetyltransferase